MSKSQPVEAIRAAYDAGCRDFGENYLQDALPKMNALTDLDITWHFIGHLQSNKARDVAQRFDWVHGVDSAKVAAALSRGRPLERGPMNVCIQVNISHEATKHGIHPAEAVSLAGEMAALAQIRLRGLMGMASPGDDERQQHAEFALLRRTAEALSAAGHRVDTLSMGMSPDFEAAIEEGATMVRIGTAIFGARSRKRAA